MAAEREGSEYVAYPEFTVEYRDASHRYWLHRDGERIAVPSVTTALRVLDKPALIGWAERIGAEGAVQLEREGELKMVPLDEVVERVRLHDLGTTAKRDSGGGRGDAVHKFIEAFVKRNAVTWDAYAGYVSAAAKWLMTANPEVLHSELRLGSWEYQFAGTCDLIAVIDGRKVIVDFKTNEKGRVYDEAHLQTAGYLGLLPECGIEDVTEAVIVALGEQGNFEPETCEAEFEDFLSVLDTSNRMYHLGKRRKAKREKREKVTA